ncbi:MAG: tRNA (adenosine(37)-N6)-dimethylallyltransferase MiaA [Bacteroidota bacterium]|nr:tRNA (adenosine(37)-N6)-dimethylallyltransferase MiaA [Bacteroidota bacterium]
MQKKHNLITVMGATAGGKTSFAVAIAQELKSEIISADSRQVYRGMDIGTGKDIEEYTYKGEKIPYHLIDILDAGNKYNVFEYQKDFLRVYEALRHKAIIPVLCGGTGMYIEAVLEGYRLIRVPKNKELREQLKAKSDKQLSAILKAHKELHNISDTSNRKRLMRAVEIALYSADHPDIDMNYPEINSLNLQVVFSRDERRKRITERLNSRIEQGMIEEVEQLTASGVPPETLEYYGLEYKFITQYLLNKMNKTEMIEQLRIAIHQFSKRQMTWFRKMEKSGIPVVKIDGRLPIEKKLDVVRKRLKYSKQTEE